MQPTKKIPFKTFGLFSKTKFDSEGKIYVLEHLTQFLHKCIAHNVTNQNTICIFFSSHSKLWLIIGSKALQLIIFTHRTNFLKSSYFLLGSMITMNCVMEYKNCEEKKMNPLKILPFRFEKFCHRFPLSDKPSTSVGEKSQSSRSSYSHILNYSQGRHLDESSLIFQEKMYESFLT